MAFNRAAYRVHGMTTSAGPRPARKWYSERAVRDLLDTVRDLADHVEEMGCTCGPGVRERHGHGRECMGVGYARKARRQLATWRRRLDV
jgi:hypothetical protein